MTKMANGKWRMVNATKKLSPFPFPLSPTRGFTLVELLVVVSVIGILAAMFMGVYTQSQKRARDGQRKYDLNGAKSALESYHTDLQYYPLGDYCGMTNTLTISRDLKAVPHDPAATANCNTTDYFYRPLQNDGITTCVTAALCQDYILCALLENTSDADITGATPKYLCRLSPPSNAQASANHNFGYHAP